MIWQLSPGHALLVRHWGEQCVLHHDASNLTLRLAAWAGQLLEDLRDHGPMSEAQLQAAYPGVEPEALLAALDSFRALDLLTCRD